MNLYLKYLIILLIISISLGVNGQINYKRGFLMTLENDTLYGKINDGGGLRNSKVCLFKADNDSKVIRYHPKDIKSYRFYNDKIYVSKQIYYKGDMKDVFLNVLIEGKVNLFYYWKDKNKSFYVEREDNVLIGLVNEDITIRLKPDFNRVAYGYEYIMNNMVYKDTLLSLFKDCNKIQNQVSNVDYNQKSLINITRAYINETCKENDCITYVKDLNPSRPSFGIFSGIQLSKISFLESKLNSKIITTIPIGIFYNLPMATISDRLSFQIELVANSLNYKQNSSQNIEIKSTTVGIPMLFKYTIVAKKVSPSFALGKETSFVLSSKVKYNNWDYILHKYQNGGWFFELGLNYQLSPKFTLFSNFRIQSNNNLIIGENENRLSFSSIVDHKFYLEKYKTNFGTLYFGLKF